MQGFKLKTFVAGLIALPLVALAAENAGLSGSFDAWNQIGDANWRIENGEFVADMGAGHIDPDARLRELGTW